MENKRISSFVEAARLRLAPGEERTSVPGVLVREMIAMVGHHMGRGAERFKPLPELEWRAPLGYVRTVEQVGEAKLEWIGPEKGVRTDKVIYQLHGGAYIAGLTNQYRTNAVRLSQLAAHVQVATLDYRTAPEHLFPAQLEDALCGYKEILQSGYAPEDIFLVGDSAGGNLALALTLKLRELGFAMPAGMLLLSPWTDLASRGESYTSNLYKDPMFGIDQGQDPALAGVTTLCAGDTPLDDPFLSPAYASLEGFPPMLIQVGSHEMLLSDSETVAAHAQEAGVQVKLTVYEGMFHVFSICCGELIPEGRLAWEEAQRFFHTVLFPGEEIESAEAEGALVMRNWLINNLKAGNAIVENAVTNNPILSALIKKKTDEKSS